MKSDTTSRDLSGCEFAVAVWEFMQATARKPHTRCTATATGISPVAARHWLLWPIRMAPFLSACGVVRARVPRPSPQTNFRREQANPTFHSNKQFNIPSTRLRPALPSRWSELLPLALLLPTPACFTSLLSCSLHLTWSRCVVVGK
jgi:hypothetical protein